MPSLFDTVVEAFLETAETYASVRMTEKRGREYLGAH
jgi:hypothetical protein